MYLRIVNNEIIYPYSIRKLREDEYNTSFPKEVSTDLLEEWNVYPVQIVPKGNDYTKNYEESAPILSGSIYVQNWNETNATDEEIELRKIKKWVEIREVRNQLLLESDWTILVDSPVSSSIDDWKTYRQSLRDITSQSNPFEIVWPNKPQ